MVQSIERALDILTYVAKQVDAPSLTQITQALGLEKSTAFRLLSCLHARGVVDKDSANRYRIGPVVFQWGSASLNHGALASTILPFLYQLRDVTNETSSFHLLVSNYHICLEQVESRQELRRAVRIGDALPLGRGATSRVLLAHLPQRERESILAKWDNLGLPAIETHEYEEELCRTRARGVALGFGESLEGAASASAPVFNASGRVVGAMSISGPAHRLPVETLEIYAARLKNIAAETSRALGQTREDHSPR